ncbi:murein biosynthesis integral membrane protein MurJ [Agromyces seonyuensis]|uniref:murein biosynthesis integral membrane protein MurJ n=1 Tax=Agromyces seonyuensis TaxID=2662446 RepID=UPI003014F45A
MADRSIGRASAFIASGTIVSRLLGFVRSMVLAASLGVVGASADAFSVGNGLSTIIFTIVAGGVLSAVVVPLIVRSASHADGGGAYINKLVTLSIVLLAAAALIATLLAPALTFVWGRTLAPETFDLAVAFAYWCLPQIFFYGLYAILGEVLNARSSFGPYTWAPVVNNVVSIVGFAVFGLVFGFADEVNRTAGDWTIGMIALVGGTATLGIAVQALVLFVFWRRVGLHFRFDFRWRGVGLRSAGRMAGWTFGMLLLSTVAGIVQANVAGTASSAGAAANAALEYAWLIFMLPHSIITMSIATAYFTRMSAHAAADRIADVRADLSSAIRGIGTIIVLAEAVLITVAFPFAAVFEPRFAESRALGWLVMAYGIGLLGFGVLFVVQRTFYALGDTRTPFFITIVQVSVFSLGSLAALALPAEYRAVGIALATTLGSTVQVIVSLVVLRRRLGLLDGRRIATAVVRSVAALILPAAAGIGIVLALGVNVPGGFAIDSRWSAIVTMVLVGTVMSVLYFGGLWLLRSPEFRGFAEPVLARLRRR